MSNTTPVSARASALMLLSLTTVLGACARQDSAAASAHTPICPCAARPQFTETQLTAAASALRAAQIRMDLCVDNCVNVQTPGFKARRPLFDTTHTPGEAPSCTVMLNVQQGAAICTQSPLDVAIIGEGWFQILTRDASVAYTRDGRLTLNADGEVVTLIGGHQLLPPIVVPADANQVQIEPDGVVVASFGDPSDIQILGRIEVATFRAPAFLRPLDGFMCVPTERSGAAATGVPNEANRGQLLAGSYESSNVDPFIQRLEMDHIRVVQSMWSGLPMVPAPWLPPADELRTSQAARTQSETR